MIIPDFLSAGDKIAVVATAKKVEKNKTEAGISILDSWGLEVSTGKHLYASSGQFAGNDYERAEDLQNIIDSKYIKAVFIARGGYGTSRIIDRIDFEPLRNHPKWICGFSDVTALGLHLFNLGISSLHSPMPVFFDYVKPDCLHWLKNFLFGESNTFSVPSYPLNAMGSGKGKIVGGNLSMLCHTIGSVSQVNTHDSILFIEDVGEQLYHLDRMMLQLKRAGLLTNIAGFIAGQFTEMKDDDPFGLTAYEIIKSHLEGLSIPMAFNFPLGHSRENYALPVGMNCQISVREESVVLQFL